MEYEASDIPIYNFESGNRKRYGINQLLANLLVTQEEKSSITAHYEISCDLSLFISIFLCKCIQGF